MESATGRMFLAAVVCLTMVGVRVEGREGDAYAVPDDSVDIGTLIQEHVMAAVQRMLPAGVDVWYERRGLVDEGCTNNIQCAAAVCDGHLRQCRCPADFSSCQGHCYRLFDTDDGISQEEAQAKCRSLGAHLAVPRSQQEHECVANQAQPPYEFIWLGINDKSREGVYMGEDGFGRISYFNWDSGEPDNRGGGGESCVVGIHTDSGYHWHDIPCDYQAATFVCQMG